MPIGVDLIVGGLIEPIRAAFVADRNEHLQQIDGRTESCADGVGVVGEASAGIHHDKRDVETFLINGTDFALNKTVGPVVFAVVGCKYDDGVVYDALRQLVELIDDGTDLLIEDLGDLGVAVESALPVEERRFTDADAETSVAIGLDTEA